MSDVDISSGGDALSHALGLGTGQGGDFTPDQVLTAIGQLDLQIHELAVEIFDAPFAVDDGFETAWDQFTQQWAAYKSDHEGWWSRAWNEARDGLIAHAHTYSSFQAQWAKMKPDTKTEDVKVPPPSEGGLKAIEDFGAKFGVAARNVLIGVGVVIGLAVVGIVVAAKVKVA